ncbi:hypothetical protein ACQ4PT_057652 [Festuca glaucescens]
MALFRRLFYRKPPDRLLEIADRVYETMDQFRYKNYMDSIVLQLREQFPDSPLMVLNFRDEGKSLVSGLFSMYRITVKDYPCQYLGCPLLPLDIIIHFLRLSERWLMLEGKQNILLMHCEKGGWPVLAFMLAALLLYRKQYNGEQRTLDMVYKQAPKELLQMLTTLNPQPSHIRYLQYICKMDYELGWPTEPIPFTLDCVILRGVPNFDGVGGCRPIVRVYGQDILTADKNRSALATPFKSKKHVRRYRQADNMPVKLNVGSCAQGDVVLECLHVDDGLENERLMFRVMFNTFFIQSHILQLNFEDIDVCWDADQRFTKNFKAEVLFSEFDAESDASTEIGSDADEDEDEDDCGDEIEVDSADEFFEANEIFSNPDSHDGHKDAETLSISSTDCTPSAEARKISPFSSLELNSDIDGSRQNKPSPFEILSDEEACTSVDTNIMHEDTTRVVSSLESTTDGGRDSSTSSSAIYKDKDDGCSVENSNPRQDRTVDPKQDSIHTDNVLVKEVIILETNSPKDIQMIKEVIISEVTTPKQVLPGDTVEMELGNAVDSSENITLTEADNTEGLDFVLKQDDGDSPIEERVTYVNGTKQEDNSNIEQPSTSDTNVLVIELTNENNRVELPLLGKPHPHSTSDTLILSSAEQRVEQSDASNSNGTAEETVGTEASISNSTGQPSNISSMDMLPVGFSLAADGALTHPSASAVTADSSRLVLKKKTFLPLSSIFAPSTPRRRNLLRSASTDLSFLSPLQTESNQNSVPSTSGRDVFATPSVSPPAQSATSLRPSKVLSLVNPPLRPIKTVSSLPSSSFEAYIEMSTSYSPTSHANHQLHVNPYPPCIPPPPILHLAKAQGKDLHPGSLAFPAPNRSSIAMTELSRKDSESEQPPSISPSLGTNDPSSSKFEEELEACKEFLPCEMIDEMSPSTAHRKEHGAIPTPPHPPICSWHRGISPVQSLTSQPCRSPSPPHLSLLPSPQHLPSPSPPPSTQSLLIPSRTHAPAPHLPHSPALHINSISLPSPPPPCPSGIVAPVSLCLPLPFSREDSISECLAAPPQSVLRHLPSLPRKNATPPPPPPPLPREHEVICPLPPISPKRHVAPSPPPPPLGRHQAPSYPSFSEDHRILFLKERKEFHLHFLLKDVKELHSLLLLEDQKGLQYKMDFKVELHRRRHPLEDMEGHLHLLVEHVEHAELHRRRHPLEDMEGHLHLLTGHVDWLRRRHFREDVKGYLHLCRYFLGHMEELHCRRHFPGDTKGLLHLLRYLLEHMEGLRRRRHLLESSALALDDSVLDADQVENLIKFCPTKEEMELLKNYTGDKDSLGKCEQFFLELMKVPRVESKFRIFAFKIQFQSQIRDVRRNLQTVASACEELRGSEKLKVIMKNILLIGNTLNEGTPRGQAVGFRLDSILKLVETRATSSRTTLMHFLCKVQK